MLIGRDVEQRRIKGVLDEARIGRSSALMIRGEAGIGKSALLRFAQEQASGMRLITAAGVPAETLIPFGGLSLLLRPWRAEINELPEQQRSVLLGALAMGPTVVDDRFRAYGASLELVARMAEREPVLIVVDDLQWMDGPSIEVLLFVARRLSVDSVAMLLAGRPPDAPPADDPFRTDLPILDVRGLRPAAARQVVRSVAGEVHPDVAGELVRNAAGYPLALVEITAGLDADHLAGRRPLPDPLPSAVSAAQLFGPQIAGLPAPVRRAMLIAALCAQDELAALLAAARGSGIADGAIEDLENTGLVSLRAGRIAFHHPLVRAAAVGAARPADIRSAHAALAAAFTDPVHEERRSWHLAEACLGPDAEVAAVLERSAMAVQRRGGHAAAARRMDRAAELSPEPADRARRWHLAADRARLSGQTDYALRLLDRARMSAQDIEVIAAVDRTHGRLELFTGHPGRAVKVLLDAGESLGSQAPRRAAGTFADAAMAAFLAGDPLRAVDLAFQAHSLAERTGDQVDLVSSLIIGTALTHLGEVPEGLRMLSEAAAIVEHQGLAVDDLEYAVFTALAHAWVGDLPAAQTLADSLVGDLRRQSALGILPLALYASSYTHAMSGRFSYAHAGATEGVELARDTRNALWSFFGLSCLTLIEAHQGEEEPCRRHAVEALGLLGSFDLQYPRDALDGLGVLELSLGRPGVALQHLEAAHQDPRTDTPPVFDGPPGADLVEAHVRTSGAVPAGLAEQVMQQSGNVDFVINASLAWRCRGLMADDDAFPECFERALELHARAGSPYDRARTKYCYGERLRRAGRRRDARRLLREAYDEFTRLGARQWARRSAEELRATGETVRGEPAAAPESLTPQEHSVASVVAGGATNNEAAAALFLSPKTIEAHLSRIYRKLGVRSRSELAARFTRSPAPS